MPLISIVLPIYNVEKYLVECLDSIAGQSLGDIEILCIIDASLDNSEQILRKYQQKDSRFKVIAHEQNRGCGAARNTGIENAVGEYVFFLDPDDYLIENSLEMMHGAAVKHAVSIVDAPLSRYVEGSQKFKRIRVKRRGMITIKPHDFDCLEYNVFRLFKADIFQDKTIRFPDKLIHEDIEFYWKIFTKYPVVYCTGKPCSVYRLRSGSLTSSPKKDYAKNNINIIKNIFKYLVQEGLLEKYHKAFSHEFYHCYYKLRDEEAEMYKSELESFFLDHNFKLSFNWRSFRKNIIKFF